MTERQKLYWTLLQQGHSLSEVARICGVSKQAVYNSTTGAEAHLMRVRKYRAKGPVSHVLKYKCSLCGSRLHTKARHEKKS